MSPIRLGVIGLRGMGGGHVRAVSKHPDARLLAVAEIDASLAETVAGRHDARAYTDYHRMLEEQPLDGVIIATPHVLHAPMTLNALDAGMHVLTEKPIAMRVSEGDRMVHRAEERGLILAVGHNYRTFPGNLMLKRLIDEGQVGPLYRVHWQWLENRPDSYYQRDRWRCTWRQAGGGVLMNQTSHDLDLLCWLVGKPVEVSAMIGNYAHTHEVEDTVVATIRFQTGAYATLQLSTCGSSLNSRHLWGEQGEIVFRDTRNANVHIPEHFQIGRYRTSFHETIRTDPNIAGQPDISWEDIDCSGLEHPSLLDSFINAVRGKGRPVTDGVSALQTLELINAIILSGVRKRVVTLPIDRDDYDAVFEDLCRGNYALK